MQQVSIRVQTDDFDQGYEYAQLARGSEAGAVVTFVGRVRDFDGDSGLWLEHYAGMTERVLLDIVERAQARWSLLGCRIVHRVGRLAPGDQIVFVGVSAPHRQGAFEACAFVMDFLKTDAPFWKKEGARWVEAKQSDDDAARAWLHDT